MGSSSPSDMRMGKTNKKYQKKENYNYDDRGLATSTIPNCQFYVFPQ